MELAKIGLIGPQVDVLGPDMGTNEQIMNLIKDSYMMMYGEENINSSGVVTGKIVSQGGISGHRESAGLGMTVVLKELLKDDAFCEQVDTSLGLKGKRVIIQGYGNMGYHFAKFMKKEGAKIIGVVERDCSLFNPEGLDPDEIQMYKQREGSFKDYPHAECETVDPSFLLRKKCDILAPCAG